ncbi:MAG: hypothetical protein HY064_12965 [Bacteroidetes bacterium]|nr:hypothetical protein [Bacteroidota bacterium]
MKSKIVLFILITVLGLACNQAQHISEGENKRSSVVEPNMLLPIPINCIGVKNILPTPDNTYVFHSTIIDKPLSFPPRSIQNVVSTLVLPQTISRDTVPHHATTTTHTASSGDPGEDDYDAARKVNTLAIVAIILSFFLFPLGIILALIAFIIAKKIKARHSVSENYKGKEEVESTLRICKGIFIGFSILIPLSFIAYLLTARAINNACYIATMVYKSYDAPEVLVLRKFRDEKLKPYFLGRLFIAIYYSTSPVFVRMFRNNVRVNNACRWMLDKLVERLRRKDSVLKFSNK